MNIVKAKMVSPSDHNITKRYHEKELIQSYNIVTTYKGRVVVPVTARFYMGRSSLASVVYCSLFAGNKKVFTNGQGEAGGYGYDKESAALGDAIACAGIKMAKRINGTGLTREALLGIAKALYPHSKRFEVITN